MLAILHKAQDKKNNKDKDSKKDLSIYQEALLEAALKGKVPKTYATFFGDM